MFFEQSKHRSKGLLNLLQSSKLQAGMHLGRARCMVVDQLVRGIITGRHQEQTALDDLEDRIFKANEITPSIRSHETTFNAQPTSNPAT